MRSLLPLCLTVLLFMSEMVNSSFGDGSGRNEHGSGGFEDGEGSGGYDDEEYEHERCEHLHCTRNEVCKERNGHFGCACGRHNPKPNPDSFDVHESCQSSSGSVSLSRCQLFDAGFPAEYLHLNDRHCKGMIKDGRVDFHFDNHEHVCGTTLETNKTHFIYKNAVQMVYGPVHLISRDSWLAINFSCVYPLIKSISMPMSILAKESVVYKDLPGEEGTYQIRMVPYKDASFTHSYGGDFELEVNHHVFVGVEVEGVDRQQFSLVLDNCWATPHNDITDNVRWDLIVNECPSRRDDSVRVLQNGVSTSSRFSFRMFTFTHQSEHIFLHCKVHLCLRTSGRCARSCNRHHGEHGSRKRRSLDFHDTAAISMGF
ncbi:pancreatic secretory granule membrane major glycoprotein GP2-like [Colossoma macropomum]|uniref:pancreatic secretory granule membrane major glycoprotein GP2-like n=1 Tax=Colossoma macropomum TaxID=42526 RepID=UPI00186469D6|nr:pancreatic secretory granule membrane major glycoprotein GP2-like [Colossoma macropomum]XP_036429113.1 pancreatic secretory granule membrane major glycoprotein GP2-like [Colossoma macropomum]